MCLLGVPPGMKAYKLYDLHTNIYSFLVMLSFVKRFSLLFHQTNWVVCWPILYSSFAISQSLQSSYSLITTTISFSHFSSWSISCSNTTYLLQSFLLLFNNLLQPLHYLPPEDPLDISNYHLIYVTIIVISCHIFLLIPSNLCILYLKCCHMMSCPHTRSTLLSMYLLNLNLDSTLKLSAFLNGVKLYNLN